MAVDILHQYPLLAEGRRTARSDPFADPGAIDRTIKELRQAGRCSGQQPFAVCVSQHDRTECSRALLFNGTGDERKQLRQRLIKGNPFQDFGPDPLAQFGISKVLLKSLLGTYIAHHTQNKLALPDQNRARMPLDRHYSPRGMPILRLKHRLAGCQDLTDPIFDHAGFLRRRQYPGDSSPPVPDDRDRSGRTERY